MSKPNRLTLDIGIRHIVAINHVANIRSIKLAAEQMHATQSTLSRLIASAEKAIGVKLFRRGWSGTEATPEGEVVVQTCRYILKAIDETELQLYEAGTAHPPLLRVLRLRHLEVVNAITRSGRVSSAAIDLQRSQPDISRSVSTLSQRLGLDCFQRTRAAMVPQPAAIVLSRLYTTIAYHLDLLEQLLQQQEGDIMGRVSVGMLPFSGQDLIPKAFAQLTNEHPKIKLVCVTGSYNGLVESLRRREIDRIIGVQRNQNAAPDLGESYLYTESFYIVARRDHPIHKKARTIADLKTTNWVVAPHGTPTRRYFETLFESIDATPPTQTCEMLSFASAEQMLIESDSVGLLSYGEKQLKNLRPELRLLKIKMPPCSADIGLTRLRAAVSEPAVAEFETILEKITGETLR